MPRSFRSAIFASGLLALAALAGCDNGWYPEGRYVSDDKYRYDSTALEAKTVVLVDTRTNQPVYTWEIPVDKELVLLFRPGDGDANRVTPDKCEWDIWDIGTTKGTPAYTFNCPPADSRRVDMFIRAIPELPADMRPGEPGYTLPARPYVSPTIDGKDSGNYLWK